MKNEEAWNISFKTMKSQLILFSIFLAFGLWTGLTRDIRYLLDLRKKALEWHD